MTKTKRIIFSTLLSLVFCVALIGISVYAATSQSAKIINSITISSSQQTRTDVVVGYALGPTDMALYDAENTELPESYTQAVSKAYDVDSIVGNGPSIVFSFEEQYTYVVYKMEFENQSPDKNSNIRIDIKTQDETPANYQFDSQVDVYFGQTDLAKKTFSNGYNLTGSVNHGESQTYYLVLAVNTDLADLASVSTQNFDILVTVE